MTSIVECCVLIPCSNVEDFPSQLAQSDARSLLGCLTAAWHPRLIAQTGRAPSWHRGDETVPATTQVAGERRLVIVPEPCRSKLPSSVASLIRTGADVPGDTRSGGETPKGNDLFVSGQSRRSVLSTIDRVLEEGPDGLSPLGLAGRDDESLLVVDDAGDTARQISPDDFHALGYTWWQIQVLTRRLRYTSNLDQVHFENCLVDAANAYVQNDAMTCAEALHHAFDVLAEERDHYFASDPSLIDLTLLTPSTVESFVQFAVPLGLGRLDDSVLPTPRNVLIDAAVGEFLCGAPEHASAVASVLNRDDWGWAGGGPAPNAMRGLISIAARESELASAMEVVTQAVGVFPRVHARLGGGTGASAMPALKAAGCVGVVPIDFLAGRGFGDESKVILGTGPSEIEALTAKPIDADDDASFLTLGTRLGESIDGGEIATGLLVHWPGGGCESFHDLRRAATWTLALGKFWTLEDYFSVGEHPYHHGHVSALSPDTSGLADRSSAEMEAELETTSQQQWASHFNAMRCLVQRDVLEDPTVANALPMAPSDVRTSAVNLAEAIGFQVTKEGVVRGDDGTDIASTHLIVNPSSPAARCPVSMSGRPVDPGREVFATARNGLRTDLILDVPAFGFGWVTSDPSTAPVSSSQADTTTSELPGPLSWPSKWSRLFRRRLKPIVVRSGRSSPEIQLANEFMEVVIDRTHGGIIGAYSGRGRGNRFSSRFQIASEDLDVQDLSVLTDTAIHGVIQLAGSDCQIRYELTRGSRVVRCRFRHRRRDERAGLKTAWAESSPIIRVLQADQVFRTSARTFTAPLGYTVDEDDRTTLVATHGAAVHRRVQDRFIETQCNMDVSSESDWTPWWTVDVAFDVDQPMSVVRSVQSPPCALPVASAGIATLPKRGWIMHPSPRTLTVQVVDAGVLGDGTRVLHLRLIATRSKSIVARVRFSRGVGSVQLIAPLSRPIADWKKNSDETLPASTAAAFAETLNSVPGDVQCHDDSIEHPMAGHAVSHVIVFLNGAFKTPPPSSEGV
ncbi:MAG: hypothetical protein AAF670_06495 [Planctomycetota bacterium]